MFPVDEMHVSTAFFVPSGAGRRRKQKEEKSMQNNRNEVLHKIVLAGILTALAVVMIALIRFPIIPTAEFLVFDGGDIPILMSGLLLGPWWGLAVTVIASLIQGFLLSPDGIVGAVMHIISSGVFVVVTSLLYRKWHSRGGALASLSIGGACMIAAMIPTNLFITAAYYGLPRAAIASMILPAILPFNAIKVVINLVVIMLIYKPISRLLHNRNWL